MIVKNVRGCYDYLPSEQVVRNFINDTLKDVFESYGYCSIETPILCYFDMLSDKYDDENDILKEIYRLRDNGNRDLGLRYDLTVPFAKFVSLNRNSLYFPFKRYEISKVFRDGPIKAGRDREFTQCDVDVVGISDNIIEAELLSLYNCAFDKLGIDIIVKYNSRKLMNGLILESGIDDNLVSIVTTIIDKKDKVNSDEFKGMLMDAGVNEECIIKLIEFFNCSLSDLNIMFKDSNNSLLIDGLSELNDLNSYIDNLGLENCVFDISLARGQNYYTGIVFEVYDKLERITSSIGGVGRYDNMITNFIADGNDYPAVGISFGLSSIYEILKNDNRFCKNSIDILIIPMDTNFECLDLSNRLRSMGYRVLVDMSFKRVKKVLGGADKNKIPYVIVLGTKEVSDNSFNLKDMNSGDSYSICFDDLDKIKDYIL